SRPAIASAPAHHGAGEAEIPAGLAGAQQAPPGRAPRGQPSPPPPPPPPSPPPPPGPRFPPPPLSSVGAGAGGGAAGAAGAAALVTVVAADGTPPTQDTAIVTAFAAVLNTTRAVVAGPRTTLPAVKPC